MAHKAFRGASERIIKMNLYEEIQLHLTDLEIIAEKLEPTHRDAMLDMIDSFGASIKQLFVQNHDDVSDEETPDGPPVHDDEDELRQDADPTFQEPELTPVADK